MPAYYNEKEPFAAAWLRELIKANLIAPGEVDERSIEDVRPDELRGFSQCHFFAGIGVWSYALRQAGWPDDREVWTGSCPCQPFSAAGKRTGTADERHLWPALYRLIAKCEPVAFFGEQVSSKDGLAWFDAVQADLEAANYAVGKTDLCSAGFGAPHIRQRLYFVGSRAGVGLADTEYAERRPKHETLREAHGRNGFGRGRHLGVPVEHAASEQVWLSGQLRFGRTADDGGLANNNNTRLEGRTRTPECSTEFVAGPSGLVGGLGVADGTGPQSWNGATETARQRNSTLTAGFWANPEWVFCRDGKYRPIESSATALAPEFAGELGLVRLARDTDGENASEETFVFAPLVTRGKARVGRLRGYGNALTAEVTKGFVESYLEVEREI